MNCNTTYNSYDSETIKTKLYDSLKQRNELFGYDAQQIQTLQKNYHDNYFTNTFPPEGPCNSSQSTSMAPLDYYFDLRTNPSKKTVIGYTALTPNLYDDNVLPTAPTIEEPNLYKNWEPFSTTATPIMKGCYVKFVPHKPVEVAPRQNIRYWGADLNARLYERRLISSAEEQPYANYYRRQGLLNLISKNVPSQNDPYLKKIDRPTDSFGCQLQRNNGNPPAVTSF